MDKFNIDIEKGVIEPRELSGTDRFKFNCYPGIECFNKCCSAMRINLTPYDIFRLKNRLELPYDEFLVKYTQPAAIDRTPLPIVVLKLLDDDAKSCPFLSQEEGCTVYTDRPSTCRYYPIGRVHMKKVDKPELREFFVLVKEDHCLGHKEDKEWTIDEWRKDQGVDFHDGVTRDWLEIVIKAKSLGMMEFNKGSLDLFFMVSSNLDMFRRFVFESRFLHTYRLEPDLLDKIRSSELELLKFSLKWLRFVLFGEGDFKVSDEARVKAAEHRKKLAEVRKQQMQEREQKAENDMARMREMKNNRVDS